MRVKTALFRVIVVILYLAMMVGAGYTDSSDEPPAVQVEVKSADNISVGRLHSQSASLENFEIKWEVISGGGTDAQSPSFHMTATLGQTAVGPGESESFKISQGYWQDFGSSSANCCQIPGDANYDGIVNILDITYLISYLYKGGPPPLCMYHGDANGDCLINILDITYLISYLYKGGPPPICADNCPGW